MRNIFREANGAVDYLVTYARDNILLQQDILLFDAPFGGLHDIVYSDAMGIATKGIVAADPDVG